MKIAIIGSRTFSDYNLLKKHLDTIKEKLEISLIVSGGSKGADLFGEKWAIENNIQTKIFLPEWDKFGKKAGFIRNVDIINEADLVIAYWDGISKGTLHSINEAKKQNKKCLIIKF